MSFPSQVSPLGSVDRSRLNLQ